MSYSLSRRAVVRLAWPLSGLTLVLLLLILAPLVRLDIGFLKGPVEEAMTTFIEAPTAVEGVGIRLGLWPTLYLENVSVAGSGWQGAPRFAQVERLELRLSLIALLRKALRIKRLAATGVRVRAYRPAG